MLVEEGRVGGESTQRSCASQASVDWRAAAATGFFHACPFFLGLPFSLKTTTPMHPAAGV